MSIGKSQIVVEYATATLDTAFKHMLSPIVEINREVLISFLNTFIPAFQGDHVQRVTPNIPDSVRPGDKIEHKFIELRVQTDAGSHYVVEIQTRQHATSDKEALFNIASCYARQTNPWYYDPKPVITLQILDYDTNQCRENTHIPDSIKEDDEHSVARVKSSPIKKKQFIKQYMMTDFSTGQTMDHLQLVQVELPRARKIKSPKSLVKNNIREWWIHILSNAGDYTREDVERMHNEKTMPDVIYKALDRLNLNKWNPNMVNEYKGNLIDKENYALALAAERKGREEGTKEGSNKERS